MQLISYIIHWYSFKINSINYLKTVWRCPPLLWALLALRTNIQSCVLLSFVKEYTIELKILNTWGLII